MEQLLYAHDHCKKTLVDGLLDASEENFAATGKPLYSSHMIDLSEEPIEENIEICKLLGE
jgi:fructose-bisphosphate aldolase class II